MNTLNDHLSIKNPNNKSASNLPGRGTPHQRLVNHFSVAGKAGQRDINMPDPAHTYRSKSEEMGKDNFHMPIVSYNIIKLTNHDYYFR